MAAGMAREAGSETDVKDILTFLEEPWGLNLNENTQPLLPGQRFILKLYYKIPLDTKNKTMVVRDKFNERVLYNFTEQEYLNYLYQEGRCNIKYIDDKPRNELVLVIGRRGTKSTIATWIAAYETYKLLKVYHPQKHYKLLPDSEIHLTMLATSEDQANLLFHQVLGYFAQSTFFHRYMNRPTSDRVSIRSRRDLEKYGEEGKASIVVKSSPCSARGVRGASNILAIMDEQAHFVDDKGASNKSDKAVYDALTPSIAQFGNDGKIVNISSPLNKTGILWDLYTQALDGAENILLIKAPSWEINTTLSSSYLRGRYNLDPIAYDCEFGGNFSERIKAWMPEDYLKRVIVPNLTKKTKGEVRVPHFIGLDIGFKGDGTAIAICHVESEEQENGEFIDKIELDYVESRAAGEPPYEDYDILDFELVSDWIKDVCQNFHIVEGLLDQHNGQLVCQNLAKKGMGQFEMIYHTRQFNSKLYQNFMMLTIDKKLRLYGDEMGPHTNPDYIEELLQLQVKQYSKNIISVEAPKLKGHHDDKSDAIMRAVWLASQAISEGMVTGRTGHSYLGRSRAIYDTNQYHRLRRKLNGGYDTGRNIKGRSSAIGKRYGR